MSTSQYLAFIRSALRSKWLRWRPRGEALQAAKRPYKGPNKRQQFEYACAICSGRFSAKEVEVDHYPRDAGSILSIEDIGEFCKNLFCEGDNLRVVCKSCHGIYTHSQKAGVPFAEAAAEKRAIEFCKQDSKIVVRYLLEAGYNAEEVSNAAKRRALVETVFKEKLDG
jgi:hypothetical protein